MTVQGLKDWFYDTFGSAGHKDMAKVLRLAADADLISAGRDPSGMYRVELVRKGQDTETSITWDPCRGVREVRYPLSASRR